MSTLSKHFLLLALVVLGSSAYAMRPNSYDLCMAAGYGNTAEIEACLARGDDINGDDGLGGMTPLAYAAFEGEVRALRLLLDRGADVDLPDYDGATPLYRLLMKSWSEEVIDVATLLIGAGATWHNANGQNFWQDANRLDQERTRRVLQAPRAPGPRRRLTLGQMADVAANGTCRRLW